MTLDLNRTEYYDIACALRGPDSGKPIASRAKCITTAVVRHFVGIKNTTSGVLSYSPLAVSELWFKYSTQQQQDIIQFLKEETHFTNHFLLALGALQRIASDENKDSIVIYRVWFNKNVRSMWGGDTFTTV